MIKVYLAGQPNKYENNWKKEFSDVEKCEFFDWETDSDQTSPDTFFPDDLKATELYWQTNGLKDIFNPEDFK